MDDLINQIDAIAEEAFAKIVADYNIAVDETIESMDAFTDLGFVNQDIVDTGRLRNSKLVTATSNTAEFEWNPVSPKNKFAYAGAVWTGFMAFGKYFVPGRHWAERTAINLNDIGITNSFVEALKNKGLDAYVVVNGDEELDY